MKFSKKPDLAHLFGKQEKTNHRSACNTSLALILMFSFCANVEAQKLEETISKELTFNSNAVDNMLVVHNVNGHIDVEGYSGNTISVEVAKTISAKNQADLQLGNREIGIKVEERNKTIFVYLDSPWTYFNLEKGQFEHRENYGGDHRRKYRYNLDFKIKVPKNLNVQLSTMNNGDVNVKNVQPNEIIVNNLNGAITLENVAGRTDVNALNKDINISYHSNPADGSKYNSLNGNINVTLKEDLNADVSFKSLNGDFYTNFDSATLNPEMTKKEVKNGKGIKYKLTSKESFRIGKGGAKLDFNLLNGDVIVKK